MNGVPPEIELVAAAYPVCQSYEVWRVVAYGKDGSYEFVYGRGGKDYKTKRNADLTARRYNAMFGNGWDGRGRLAVVRRIRVTEAQVSEEGE